MEVKIKENNYLGIILGWNGLLNNKVCIVLNTCDISYNTQYNFCKVLVEQKIHTVPRYFIKKLDSQGILNKKTRFKTA